MRDRERRRKQPLASATKLTAILLNLYNHQSPFVSTTWTPRHAVAETRLRNILQAHVVATARILEQKISDAGPVPQRIDPHILTEARKVLTDQGVICERLLENVQWYHLGSAVESSVRARLTELTRIHNQVQHHQFTTRLGQPLEIAVYRALREQSCLEFFGCFPDLDEHDDSTRYTKKEPPRSLSGRRAPGGKIPDFLVHRTSTGYAGIEAKNVREWFYPNREEIRDLLIKCCSLDIVPVLIARRIHYSTFSALNPTGVILHQTYNQLYPATEQALAEKARHKDLLGYHDIRIGNEPDQRLRKFIHKNLPTVLPGARQRFNQFKDLLRAFGSGEMPYKSFAARVKRRQRGGPEDFSVPDDQEFYEG